MQHGLPHFLWATDTGAFFPRNVAIPSSHSGQVTTAAGGRTLRRQIFERSLCSTAYADPTSFHFCFCWLTTECRQWIKRGKDWRNGISDLPKMLCITLEHEKLTLLKPFSVDNIWIDGIEYWLILFWYWCIYFKNDLCILYMWLDEWYIWITQNMYLEHEKQTLMKPFLIDIIWIDGIQYWLIHIWYWCIFQGWSIYFFTCN